jgi:hypothetical protein
MEPLVNGLIQELLDLKSIAMMMSRETGERSYQGPEPEPMVQSIASPALTGLSSASVVVSSESSMIIRIGGTHKPDVPATTAEPAMARIMKSDGTMKFEIRYREKNPIDSSTGCGAARMIHLSKANKTP